MDIAIAVAIGLAAGIISGMLGVGGGTISVPALVLLLEIEQHTAQGVALAVMLFTALIATLVHYRQGNVKLRVVLLMAPSAVAFAYLGAWAAGQVSDEWLARVFALLLLLIGTRMLLYNGGGQRASVN